MLTKNLGKKELTTEQINDEFTALDQNRRDWQPSNLPKENLVFPDECFEKVLRKGIALSLNLELPVGAFIRSVLAQREYMPPTIFNGLFRNIEDEAKHQSAFENIAKQYPPLVEDLQQANEFRKYILKFKVDPLIKARDLEIVIFIPLQTYMRYVGGEALERVIADISHDEYRHIFYNTAVADTLNLGFDINFIEYLIGIGQWVFSDLPDSLSSNPMSKAYWIESLFQMAETGSSGNLYSLMNYGIHRAPFEIANSHY